MALISEVKCSRCDRRYSGFRTRCPYCGARRSKRGKRVADSDNAAWKVIVGILLLVIVIAAVIVLVLSAAGKDNTSTDNVVTSPTPTFSENEGVTSYETSPSPTPTVDSTPTPTVEVPTLESVSVNYLGSAIADVTMSVTDVLDFTCGTVPAEYTGTGTPEWSSSDENIFVVLQTGKVTAIGKGTATLTVTLDGVSSTCIIRVK